MKLDVMGLGGLIIDDVLMVSEEFLATIPGRKGGMEPVSYEMLQELREASGIEPISIPGGSAANTMKGLARLGRKAGMLGKIGEDDLGRYYCDWMQGKGVQMMLVSTKTPTARLLALVTPDGQRTFRTFQGASLEMGAADLREHFFEQAHFLHVEGYSLFNGDLIEKAMGMAKHLGLKISFDMANFEIVRQFKSTISHLLEHYVDIIFCNQDEARAFTGCSEKETVEILGSMCEVGVVSLAERGCYVSDGRKAIHCPAYLIESPLDTTGAGDLFASGFLHGYLAGREIRECARFGSMTGASVIQVPGAEIPEGLWGPILGSIEHGEPFMPQVAGCRA